MRFGEHFREDERSHYSGLLLGDERRTARRLHRCYSCGRDIEVGSRYRRQFAVFDDEPVIYKFCDNCAQYA